MAPQVAVLTGYGINSDKELSCCFTRAGFICKRIHIGDFTSKLKKINDYQVLAFPGGFSFGDHIASGRVLANKMKTYLKEDLARFLADDKLLLGICNGFQVLVKLGILPYPDFLERASLITNLSGKFEDRWVNLKVPLTGKSPWLTGIDSLRLPVRHGEGRFVAAKDTWGQMQKDSLFVLHYVDQAGHKTEAYPLNPNGSRDGVGGIIDPSGKVLGLMPHPEAFLDETNAPSWKTSSKWASKQVKKKLIPGDGAGMAIFYNARRYFK